MTETLVKQIEREFNRLVRLGDAMITYRNDMNKDPLIKNIIKDIEILIPKIKSYHHEEYQRVLDDYENLKLQYCLL